MGNTRKAEVYKEGRGWFDIHPLELKLGDIFRMFEEDKTPIAYNSKHENYVFIAKEDCREDDDGVWGIECDIYEGELN